MVTRDLPAAAVLPASKIQFPLAGSPLDPRNHRPIAGKIDARCVSGWRAPQETGNNHEAHLRPRAGIFARRQCSAGSARLIRLPGATLKQQRETSRLQGHKRIDSGSAPQRTSPSEVFPNSPGVPHPPRIHQDRVCRCASPRRPRRTGTHEGVCHPRALRPELRSAGARKSPQHGSRSCARSVERSLRAEREKRRFLS